RESRRVHGSAGSPGATVTTPTAARVPQSPRAEPGGSPKSSQPNASARTSRRRPPGSVPWAPAGGSTPARLQSVTRRAAMRRWKPSLRGPHPQAGLVFPLLRLGLGASVRRRTARVLGGGLLGLILGRLLSSRSLTGGLKGPVAVPVDDHLSLLQELVQDLGDGGRFLPDQPLPDPWGLLLEGGRSGLLPLGHLHHVVPVGALAGRAHLAHLQGEGRLFERIHQVVRLAEEAHVPARRPGGLVQGVLGGQLLERLPLLQPFDYGLRLLLRLDQDLATADPLGV